MGLPIIVSEAIDGKLYVPGYSANDAADRVRSRLRRGAGEVHADLVTIACDEGSGRAFATDLDGLREEFVVCGAAGHPSPYAPTPNTLQEALRFVDGHRFDHVRGETVHPVIKRRLATDWEEVVIDA